MIISKPNKPAYDNPKSFCPIVLLNTISKLIEKVIAERLQFHIVNNDFVHPSQLGGLKFKSTTDAGIVLTHIIQSGWVKNKTTSILAFDIAQFFPSLNYHLLTHSLSKVGFDSKVISFFEDFLVKRKTNYMWNKLFSPMYEVNVGVGQGSTLSPILSALYLSPLLNILEKCLKILNILISLLSFVDDGLFISQNKSIDISNSQLFYSYNVLSGLLERCGLNIEHSKTEMFYFNRSHRTFNPSLLDLLLLEGPILHSKNSWKYLGFIFDQKLTFHQHINFYSNKAISMVKCMKLLGNSTPGINTIQKCLLYRCCVLPIALYRFQLWFYNKAPLSYPIKILGKMQRRAAIWILGAFKTSSTEGLKAIAELIPIKLYLQKLANRSQLHSTTLPENHIIKTLMDDLLNTCYKPTSHLINTLTDHQKISLKSHLINSNNKAYGIFSFFSPLNLEFFTSSHILDNFPDCFSSNLVNKKEKDKDKICAQELDDMVLRISPSHQTALVVTDASIKNNIAISISHVHIANQPLTKTVYHAVFITSTEAELFTIRYSINQACSKDNVSKIIIITDSIHAAKIIFDSKSHLY